MRSRLTWLLATMLTFSACGTRVDRQQTMPTGSQLPSEHQAARASGASPAVPDSAASPDTAPAARTGTPAAGGKSTGGKEAPAGNGSTVTSPAAPRPARPRAGDPAPSSSGGAAQGNEAGVPQIPAPNTPAPNGGTRTPLIVGTVGTLSGPIGSVVIAGVETIQMWVRAVNGRGGLNGHQVKHIAADDGGDPARHRALVQDFVESKKVLAFVGNPEVLSGASSVEYITQKRIPVLGSEGGGLYFYSSPMYFPQASSGVPLLHALFDGYARGATTKGLKKIALLACIEAPVCRTSRDIWTDDAKKAGLDVVYRADVSLTQPDFTAECLQAQRAGAEMIAPVLVASGITRLGASCNRQDYRPMILIGSATVALDHVNDPNLDGSAVGLPNFPWFMDDTPGRKEFHAVLAKYGGGKPATAAHANGWVNAKLLERAGARVSEPPTSQSLLEGLWAMNGDDLGGITAPLRFVREQKAPELICSTTVLIENKQWVPVDGGRMSCRN